MFIKVVEMYGEKNRQHRIMTLNENFIVLKREKKFIYINNEDCSDFIKINGTLDDKKEHYYLEVVEIELSNNKTIFIIENYKCE